MTKQRKHDTPTAMFSLLLKGIYMNLKDNFKTVADKFSYSLVDGHIYEGGKIKHPITCTCGHTWDIIYSNLKSGHGCPECKKKSLSAKNKGRNTQIPLTTEEFLVRLSTVRDDVEILGEYVRSNQKVKTRCKVCNHEWNVRPAHLMSNSRCPECNRRNYNNRTIDAKLIGDFENIRRITDCETPGETVGFYCSDCGENFYEVPSTLLNNKNILKCPVCRARSPNKYGFDQSKPGYLYIAAVLVNDYILYKVGITNREPAKRLAETFNRFAIHKTFYGSGEQVLKLEATIKRLMVDYKAFKRGEKVDCKSGQTEIYTENPMFILKRSDILAAMADK